MTNRIEFFIEREGRGYALRDGQGDLHVDATFDSVESASDMAHRFAQDNDLLPAFFLPLSYGR
jgi:hypothetical protein